MIEQIFAITNEINESIRGWQTLQSKYQLKMQVEILVRFNKGVLDVSSNDLFKQYEKFYLPLHIGYYDSKDAEQEKYQEQNLDLIEELKCFLNNKLSKNYKFFALLGDSCSGKSIATQRIIDVLWQNFVSKNRIKFINGLGLDVGSWFAFYIDCSVFNGNVTKYFVDNVLKNQYRLDFDQINYLKLHCNCLIILDGIEKISEIVKVDSLCINNLKSWSRAKFFITCKTDKLNDKKVSNIFTVLQSQIGSVASYYLKNFNKIHIPFLTCEEFINKWFNKNYAYIQKTLESSSWLLFNNKNIKNDEIFNSFLNYMMEIAFHMYVQDKITEDLMEVQLPDNNHLFWKLCLINLTCSDVKYFPKINKKNNGAAEQCLFYLGVIDTVYLINMQKSFRNYLVANILYLDLQNNLEVFIDKLRKKSLTGETEIIDYLIEFFKKLENSKKSNLQTLIKNALITIEKTDFNVFHGLNTILKEFDLINDYHNLIVKPELPKTDDFQEKSLLFSYNEEPFSFIDFKEEQNKVNLIEQSNGFGFSLLCFELYSPSEEGMITYYVKLSEEKSKQILNKKSPTIEDFEEMDIINLFSGISQNVPIETKQSVSKVFFDRTSFIYYNCSF